MCLQLAGPIYVGSRTDLKVVPIDSVTPSDGTVQEKRADPPLGADAGHTALIE